MVRQMKSLLLIAIALAVFAPRADAAPKKKYHFKLTKVLTKPEVKGDVAKEAQPWFEAVVNKAIVTNPLLVLSLHGAPDPEANPATFRKFLTRTGIHAAYLVTV